MALECRIIRAADGSIDYVNTEGGTRSALFDNLARLSNKEVALDMYALTETEQFKEFQPAMTTEPTAEEVIAFATQRETNLDEEQIKDIEDTIVASGLSTYGELLNRMKQIFYKNGVAVFDRASIENSGFYNQYEVDSIMEDVTIQNRIKDTINGLTNTDSETLPDYDPLFVVSETSRINALGKQAISNPFIIEQQVIGAIVGTNVEDSITNLPFENIKNQYNSNSTVKTRLDNIAAKTKMVAQQEIVGGQLVDKTNNNTREVLEQTLDLRDRLTITAKIQYIQGISPGVWGQSRDSIYTLLKDLNKASVYAGVDFLNLEDSAFTKERGQVIDLLNSYQRLLNNPSDASMQEFTDIYSDFFEINNEPASKVVTSNDAGDVYIETDLTEYQLFNEHGLVKKGENLYREVEVMESLDDVYSTMTLNKTLLPVGVETQQDLRDYISNQVAETPIPDFQVDTDVLQKMFLYKMYFRSPVTQPIIPDNTDKYVQFTGDYDYMTEEYPSDFYKDMLREKRKNSDMYKNFYSNFTITSKGIELVNRDPLTIRQIMRLAPEDLIQYNMVSKTLNLPVAEISEDTVDFDQMVYNREQAINNPDGVPKLKQDYTILSPITIAVKNATSNFVRTPMGSYEIDYQIGNVTFYNMLPKGNSKYNAIGVYNSKTQPDINEDDFAYLQDTPEAFTKAQSYYSASELRRINEKYFNC